MSVLRDQSNLRLAILIVSSFAYMDGEDYQNQLHSNGYGHYISTNDAVCTWYIPLSTLRTKEWNSIFFFK